ncbi:MAG: DegQ family serine endoprotease [Deltaproteobacteria bacterium]|nr:DegQ family serine endoprotease [Deltaproteobacteria bacterium]
MRNKRFCSSGSVGFGFPVFLMIFLGLVVSAGFWSLPMGPANAEAAGTLPGSFSELVKKCKPAVVNISTSHTVKRSDRMQGLPGGNQGKQFRDFFGQEFFDQFFGKMPKSWKERSLGSGLIISPDGYIVTNHHVIKDADVIKIRLSDQKIFDAKIIGKDPKTDLALIKINSTEKLHVLDFGDSGILEEGDWVLAIGNPFGLAQTVTAGIVSAKERSIGIGPYDQFIQTDASINPGNSGGPLINLAGEVVGINTAIVAGGQGIGFATPSSLAKNIIAQLREKGKVVRGWLGVYVQAVTPELAEKFKLKDAKGALVASVGKDSPAEKAGFKQGDVIVSFDGKAVDEMNQLPIAVASTPIGKKAKVEIIRDSKPATLEVAVGELKDDTGEESAEASADTDYGLTLQDLTDDLAKSMHLKDTKGVLVADVEQDGPAFEAGFKRGDVIKEVNRTHVNNIEEFRSALKKSKDNVALVLVKRGSGTIFLTMKMESGK